MGNTVVTDPAPVRHLAASGRRARPTRRSGAWRLADAALSLAAIGGVLCIAAVIAASFFDITLVMFKTGSMSPTIPTGSLAVVREIPASEAAVGDVVTVDRTDLLPITHRITSVTDAGNGFTSITMRGDANLDEDPEPYVVQNVRTVLFAMPGLATFVVAFSNPYVLGGITFGAAALVTWAFWPRGTRRAHRLGAGAAVVLVLGIAPAVVTPTPAQAAEVETVVRAQYVVSAPHLTPVTTPEPTTGRVGDAAESGLVSPSTPVEQSIALAGVAVFAGLALAGAARLVGLRRRHRETEEAVECAPDD